MNIEIEERLQQLRERMKERNLDAYLVPTADYHGSEYVGEHFKCRKYLTGFTGSAGTAVVTAQEACLWVDGRYFVQAAGQLAGTSIQMMKMGQEGVPTVAEYLMERLPGKGRLGFDGRVMNALEGIDLERRLEQKKACISCNMDLAGEIWRDRPPLSEEAAWVLHTKYAGKSAKEKIADLRQAMKVNGATVHMLTSLDDIAWLLNIRGADIRFNPVVLAYALVTLDKLYLFVNEKVLGHFAYPYMDMKDGKDITVKAYLEETGVTALPYDSFYDKVSQLRNERVMLERGQVNYTAFKLLDASNQVLEHMNPTAQAKAVKNPVEVENEKNAHIKDGVAVTRFIYWLEKNVGIQEISELDAAAQIEAFRAEQEGYIEPSFETISAYGAHGAMCHYSANKESNVRIQPEGFYLVDSGGQYYEGTTDITRTIAVGPVTEEEKKHFTLVLMSMLRLGAVRFLHGCRGLSLDYVAREPLWSRGLNYEHGTGHGVGYLLNVHERPNGIRYRMVPERQDNGVLEEGMITSDEPGVYIEGKHGIRTENLILCVKDEKNEYGQFMKFEFLTFVPVDRDAIDRTWMTERDVWLLNEYHRQVYEKISPYLPEEERQWLEEATAPVKL